MKKHVTRIQIVAMVGAALYVSFASMTAAPAMACDCARPGSPREELQRADAVFSGEVSNVSKERGRIEFKVEKIWKGPRAKRISIEYEQSDCTYVFVVGKKYLVYAHGKDLLSTSICARTQVLDKASDDLNELGEGEKP